MKKLIFVLRIVGAVFAAGMMVWFIAPICKYRLVNIGNLTGIVLCLWLLCLCIAPVQRAVRGVFKKRGWTWVIYRAATLCLAAFVAYGMIVTAAIVFSNARPPQKNATAVVLGAQVTPSGAPSRVLNKRIEAAERYLKDNPEAKAVLTGGKGSDELISEAECMYRELTRRGIAPDRLVLEDKATDTAENFKYSWQLIEEQGLNRSLAVITDGFHQPRAKLIAEKQGIATDIGSVCADTEWIFVPTYIVREWFAIPTLLWK